MNESVLDTIKQMLGLSPDYTPFDMELLVFINSAFITLKQLGVGDGTGITGSREKIEDFITDPALVPLVQNYIYLKVRTVWDVNSISAGTLQAYKEQITELEWRIREENEKVIYDHE